jgi:hypothetical protein
MRVDKSRQYPSSPHINDLRSRLSPEPGPDFRNLTIPDQKIAVLQYAPIGHGKNFSVSYQQFLHNLPRSLKTFPQYIRHNFPGSKRQYAQEKMISRLIQFLPGEAACRKTFSDIDPLKKIPHQIRQP